MHLIAAIMRTSTDPFGSDEMALDVVKVCLLINDIAVLYMVFGFTVH